MANLKKTLCKVKWKAILYEDEWSREEEVPLDEYICDSYKECMKTALFFSYEWECFDIFKITENGNELVYSKEYVG